MLKLFPIIFYSLSISKTIQAKCHGEEILDPSGKYCFILHAGQQNFHDAETSCFSYGGYHLAMISNLLDNNFLLNHTIHSSTSSSYFWIGATDLTSDGTWEWVDGSGMQFQNWSPLKSVDGDCAVMRRSDGRWQAYDCTQELPFYCYGRAPDSPTETPTTSIPTTKPVRHETVFIKYIGDAESMGDPNIDPNALIFYTKQREYIKQVSDYIYKNPHNSENVCSYYSNVAFYGYAEYQQSFDLGSAWDQQEFDNLLEGNAWNLTTTHAYNITDAINGVKKYEWVPPMKGLGYTVLVFFTARQDFTGIPSLFVPFPNFDELIVVTMNNSTLSTPYGVPHVKLSINFDTADVQNLVDNLKCH